MFMIDYNPSLLRKMDRENGYEDGFADGESVGFSRGEMEIKKQVIKKMLAYGMTDDEIMILTDCPRELINELRK